MVSVFLLTSYSVPSSTPIGANILTVEATDGDVEENSRISYRLQKVDLFTFCLLGLTSINHVGASSTQRTGPHKSLFDRPKSGGESRFENLGGTVPFSIQGKITDT